MNRISIPAAAFVVLIIVGLYFDYLSWRQVGVFSLVAVGAAVLILVFGLPFVLLYAFLAILDIVLLFYLGRSS